MAKQSPIPTIPPNFSNELNVERTTIQQPTPSPQLSPDFDFLLGGSSIGLGLAFATWYLYDRVIRPWGNPKLAKMMHPYENLESIKNIVQVVRSESLAQRAILLELNTRSGLMFDISQECDSGYSQIYFSPNDNHVSCVKKILERFHNEKFIHREVGSIEVDSYKGFLKSNGVHYAIYCKVGGDADINWILALHYFRPNHVDFMTACKMQEIIGDRCDALYYQLMQRSPVKLKSR